MRLPEDENAIVWIAFECRRFLRHAVSFPFEPAAAFEWRLFDVGSKGKGNVTEDAPTCNEKNRTPKKGPAAPVEKGCGRERGEENAQRSGWNLTASGWNVEGFDRRRLGAAVFSGRYGP
jgi:hypothetical protein